MYTFNDFLSKLSENSSIPFKIIKNSDRVIFDSIKEIENPIEKGILLRDSKATLIMDKKFEMCTSLLKYSIEDKYKELYDLRNQLIIEILEDRGIYIDNIYKIYPFLQNKCVLFLISVNNNKYEVLNILKEYYSSEEFVALIYKDYILALGNFEDELEHARGMKELIFSNIYVNPYISYSVFEGGAENLKEAFKNAAICIVLGKKYGLKSTIYDSKSLLLEKIINSINKEMKEELYSKFNSKFIKFDKEMINTIQELMNCGLNISEAAKKLYIHRNTLIYRLDKIEKDTGYDIREFKQAIIFTIAFLTWKEKHNNEY